MKKGQFLPDSAASQAVALVEDGKSFSEASAHTGLCWENVKAACKRRGVDQSPKAQARARLNSLNGPLPKRPKEVREERDRIIQTALKAGCSYSEIGSLLGLTRCQVAGAIYRMRSRGSKS